MKRKAIIGIIVSLILATSGVLIASVKSSGIEPTLQVLPGLVIYSAANVTNIFTVNVTVANVTDLFGYEFKLSWNTTLLDCLAADVTPPKSWNNSYVIAVNKINETSGQYWLAVVALPVAGKNVTSFTGNTSLAGLTFKVTYTPMYPQNVSSPIHLFGTSARGTILVDKDANAIDHTTLDGEYQGHSLKPVVKVLPSNYNATAAGITFQAEVWVFNVTNLASFTLNLTFDGNLLWAPVPKFGNILPHPHALMLESTHGMVIASEGSSTSVNGSGLLGTVTFTTCMSTSNASCVLNATSTLLKTMGNATIPHDTINGKYRYINLPGEVDGDGVVDVRDIAIEARAFGSYPGHPLWDPRADLNHDNLVDVLDLAKVCANFGKHI